MPTFCFSDCFILLGLVYRSTVLIPVAFLIARLAFVIPRTVFSDGLR